MFLSFCNYFYFSSTQEFEKLTLDELRVLHRYYFGYRGELRSRLNTSFDRYNNNNNDDTASSSSTPVHYNDDSRATIGSYLGPRRPDRSTLARNIRSLPLGAIADENVPRTSGLDDFGGRKKIRVFDRKARSKQKKRSSSKHGSRRPSPPPVRIQDLYEDTTSDSYFDMNDRNSPDTFGEEPNEQEQQQLSSLPGRESGSQNPGIFQERDLRLRAPEPLFRDEAEPVTDPGPLSFQEDVIAQEAERLSFPDDRSPLQKLNNPTLDKSPSKHRNMYHQERPQPHELGATSLNFAEEYDSNDRAPVPFSPVHYAATNFVFPEGSNTDNAVAGDDDSEYETRYVISPTTRVLRMKRTRIRDRYARTVIEPCFVTASDVYFRECGFDTVDLIDIFREKVRELSSIYGPEAIRRRILFLISHRLEFLTGLVDHDVICDMNLVAVIIASFNSVRSPMRVATQSVSGQLSPNSLPEALRGIPLEFLSSESSASNTTDKEDDAKKPSVPKPKRNPGDPDPCFHVIGKYERRHLNAIIERLIRDNRQQYGLPLGKSSSPSSAEEDALGPYSPTNPIEPESVDAPRFVPHEISPEPSSVKKEGLLKKFALKKGASAKTWCKNFTGFQSSKSPKKKDVPQVEESTLRKRTTSPICGIIKAIASLPRSNSKTQPKSGDLGATSISLSRLRKEGVSGLPPPINRRLTFEQTMNLPTVPNPNILNVRATSYRIVKRHSQSSNPLAPHHDSSEQAILHDYSLPRTSTSYDRPSGGPSASYDRSLPRPPTSHDRSLPGPSILHDLPWGRSSASHGRSSGAPTYDRSLPRPTVLYDLPWGRPSTSRLSSAQDEPVSYDRTQSSTLPRHTDIRPQPAERSNYVGEVVLRPGQILRKKTKKPRPPSQEVPPLSPQRQIPEFSYEGGDEPPIMVSSDNSGDSAAPPEEPPLSAVATLATPPTTPSEEMLARLLVPPSTRRKTRIAKPPHTAL